MKLIIAGSRTLNPSSAFLMSCMRMLGIYNVKEIVSGTANGVDKSGEELRTEIDFHPTIKQFPADWNKHGKAAGPIRNKQMAEYADALLLIWDGESRGSANMKMNMEKLGKPVYEVILRGLK